MRPSPILAQLLIAAWSQAEAETYLQAYHEVRSIPELEQPLVDTINTLLDRMHQRHIGVHPASIEFLGELRSIKGRFMVMAAAVEIAFHGLRPGVKVFALSPEPAA